MAVLSDDMGGITAYAAAVNRGYTGTKEEFEQLMYSYTEVAERAEAAAGNAHESEEASIEAKDISVGAKNEAVSARDAAVSARDASISAKNNSESARDVAISAKDDTLAAKDAVMSAKSSVDETSANFSDEVTAAISDVNAAGRNQKELAKTHAVDSEAWAVGQREGADVGVSDETYHNNSKYYAEQSALAKSETETARDAAVTAKNDAVSAKNEAETAKGDAQDIVDGINAKSEQIDQNAEDISDLQTAISTKAEVDGNYENLTAGTAEQLASTVFIEDNAPYIIRKSLADGSDRLYDQIVGGTVCFNQIVPYYTFADRTAYGITFSRTGYKFSFSGTGANTGGYVDLNSFINILDEFVIGHKYLLDTSHSKIYVVVNNPYTDSRNTKIFSPTSKPTYFFARLEVADGESVSGNGYVNVYDLTAMFGSTVADYIYQLEQTHAGDGVAFFKALFPNDYYEYNSGELVSVSGLSAHKMVGFNQWDEEWESGSYDANTGLPVTYASRIRCKNPIRVVPGAQYYCKYANTVIIRFYDFDDNFIGASFNTTAQNSIATVPSNAVYMRIVLEGATSYSNNVCINLSDPTRNGQYEPYKAHSYPLDSSLTLRGLFKLDANNNLYADGDTYDADGTVTRRYGVVDLGTLTYNKIDVAQGTMFRATVSLIKQVADSLNLLCTKYVTSTPADRVEKTISKSTGANVDIIDSSYTDAAAFKAAMSGVMLVYELATPTTEQAQPFTNPQICDGEGTEEYVTNSVVPVGHVTKYANNLRAKLEMAPNSPDGDGDYIVRQTSGLNEYVSLSSSEVIQNINEAISDNAEQIQTNADDISELKEELKNTLSTFAENIILVKNLVYERVTGKRPRKDGTVVVFDDDASYNYVSANVEGEKYYTSSKQISGNFSYFVTENNTWLANAGTVITTDSGYVYKAPAGATKFIMANGSLPEDVVLLEGRNDITSYSYTDYPYNTVVDVEIPTLEASLLSRTLQLSTKPYVNDISAVPDLNNASDNVLYGLYFTSAYTTRPANWPNGLTESGAQFIVATYAVGDTQKLQLIVYKNAVWVRTYTTSTWGAWNKIGWSQSDLLTMLNTIYRPVITIAADGSGDYTTFKEGIQAAMMLTNATVILKAGTYNLYEEWGGDVWANSYAYNTDGPGLHIGKGIHLIADSLAKVTYEYNGGNTDLKENFSPLNSGATGDFTIENLNIVAKNCRYVFHDELASNTAPQHHKFINCDFYLDNTDNATWKNKPCIGGGLGADEEIIIDKCRFEAVTDGTDIAGASYHNADGADCRSVVVITNSYCADHNTFAGTARGLSQLITPFIVNGCSVYTAPYVGWDSENQPYENMILKAWGNDIRNA